MLTRKVSMKWKNWSEFRVPHSTQVARRKLREDRDTILELTAIAKWSWLYERFERFSGCWVSPQWTIPRYQSTCVFPTSSSSWWNAQPFYRNAKPQRLSAKHLGHTWYIGKRFLQIQQRLLQHLIRRNWIHGVLIFRNQFTHHRRGRMRIKHQFRIRDASPDHQPKIQPSLTENIQRIFKDLWGRPTTTADFRSSFRQIHHTNNVCLLEDKIQDWGMYLFTISYGSHDVDQRSGDGRFSGWFEIFVICKRNSNARFSSTRCEDWFVTEQNHP